MKPDAENYLQQVPMCTRKKNTLQQLRDLLEEMGQPDRPLKMIHVAGTNGKGSVCTNLTYMLMEAGYQVGTFVSPHLIWLRERILLNSKMVDRQCFQISFERVYDVVQKMMSRGYCHPTYFEFLFLIAIDIYAGWGADYVILETGLGGRLDTTNVIERPIACVITSISLEHTRYLGDTIEQIAGEKAGIIKPGIPVIYDNNNLAAAAVIRQYAGQMKAPAYPVSQDGQYREISFAAPYQAMNAALAVKTLQVLGIAGIYPEVIKRGLEKVKWPGRMEPVGHDIWLDGAHNPGGISAFILAAKGIQEKNPKNIHLLFAVVEDKDYNEMIQMLCRELAPKRVTIARIQSERSMEADTLVDCFKLSGCKETSGYPDTGQALDAALSNKTEADRLFVIGSLYLVGEIKEQISRRKENAGLRG